MAVTCKTCGGPHPTWDCTPEKVRRFGSTAARKDVPRRTESGSTLKPNAESGASRIVPVAGTQAPPVDDYEISCVETAPTGGAAQTLSDRVKGIEAPIDPLRSDPVGIKPAGRAAVTAGKSKRGRGRPKTIEDMRAYKAEKERERRARLKEQTK